MQTVAEIEASIAEPPEIQQWEIAKWLEESLPSEETPVMLAALDEESARRKPNQPCRSKRRAGKSRDGPPQTYRNDPFKDSHP